MNCESCGASNVPLIKHHIDGKSNSKRVVYICPNCHSLVHGEKIMYRNKASESAIAEIDRLSKDRFVSPYEIDRIFDRFEYKPEFDR